MPSLCPFLLVTPRLIGLGSTAIVPPEAQERIGTWIQSETGVSAEQLGMLRCLFAKILRIDLLGL